MGRFLSGLLRRNQCPRRAPAKRQARRSLIVEPLEDRRLLEAAGLDPWPASTLVITEVDTSPNDRVEFTNVSGQDLDISGWQVVTYDRLSKTAPQPVFTIPAGTICPEDGVFLVGQQGDSPGAYPAFHTGREIAWKPGKETGVMLRDANGQVVDFMAAAALDPARITKPAAIGPAVWRGGSVPSQPDSSVTYQRIGSADHNTAADWVTATPSLGQWNAGLTQRVGPLDHFTFSPIAPTQDAGTPFLATLTAQDAKGRTVTDFAGTVELSGWVKTANDSTLVISEVDTSPNDRIEFSNVSGRDLDISGWQVITYDRLSKTSPRPAFAIPAGTICPADGVFVVREHGKKPGAYPTFATGKEIAWQPNKATGVFLRDASGQVVDFMAAAALDPAQITKPAPIGPDVWQGGAIPSQPDSSVTYQRIGSADNNNAADWVVAVPSLGQWNTGLTFPPPEIEVPIDPRTATFAHGAWTGQIMVLTEAAGMFLRADDGNGHRAESNTFDVNKKLSEIRGTVWRDEDADGKRDPGEPGVGGWQLYLDFDRNGRQDADEPGTSTSPSGEYVFRNVPDGVYRVAQTIVPGWMQTFPGFDPAPLTRVNLGPDGAQANREAHAPAISADGRCVAFISSATNLVPGDPSYHSDVFVYDRLTGAMELASPTLDGGEADGSPMYVSLSSDGRFVVFTSYATNLVPGDSNQMPDIFVFDRKTRTTERVSVASDGTQGDWISENSAISADGRYVAFESLSRNLVPGDSNGHQDIFVYDRRMGTIERVSVGVGGAATNNHSHDPAISGDGRYVTFSSYATNLVPGDTNSQGDIFVYDRQNRTTERISVASDGAQADRSSMQPTISFDGRWVVFESVATNLAAGDTNGQRDIFLHDRQTGRTERVSVGADGAQANGMCMLAKLSADGRFVMFDSQATNLVAGDTNGQIDVFLYDRQFGTLRRLSVAATGAEGNGTSGPVAMSADGAWAVFASEATNLVPDDTNGCPDILLRRLDYSNLMPGQTVAIVAGQTVENVDFGNRPPIFVAGGTTQATWSSAPRATSGGADLAGNTRRPSFYRAVRALPRRAAHENTWTLAVDRVLESQDPSAADWLQTLA